MIILDNVSKIFPTGATGLSNVSVHFERGEFAFITGQTGSGKTTLLKLIIREMLPTDGTIVVDDINVVSLEQKKIPHLRKKIGIVFQDLKLLSDRTVLENVLLPLEIAGKGHSEALQRAQSLLEDVGVSEHALKFPQQLSGGELQRVAIARALTLDPAIIIADEPTGNLDDETAVAIVELLHAINKKGTTIIMVTHNSAIVAKYPDHHHVVLEKGKVTKDTKKKHESKRDQTDHLEKQKTLEKVTDADNSSIFSGSIEESVEKIEPKKGEKHGKT